MTPFRSASATGSEASLRLYLHDMETTYSTHSLKQAGALCYRVKAGRLQVLLVTSRDTGRWIIPKGFIEAGKTVQATALMEAHEEAGVVGTVLSSLPIGFIPYFKILEDGSSAPASIEVYAVRVERRDKSYRESGQRVVGWFTPEEAAGMVAEPALAALFGRLSDLVSSEVADGQQDE